MPADSGKGETGKAEGFFAEFLAKKRTTGQTYEEFRARHPEHADELDRLHEAYQHIKALERASEPPTTISGRLREQYGDRIPIEIRLKDDPGHTHDEHGHEHHPDFIEKLVGRGEGYGPYVLRGEIARGGQGAVLRVWDQDLNRTLAMKVILGKDDERPTGKTPQMDAHTLGRFLEEAQITGQLDHPGIVPVHELGVDAEGRVFFTMKLVKGRSLAAIFDLVHEGKEGWNLTRALGVIQKVCEAMAYAHAKGVIHRDLKPANVMVGRFGEVYVMDWGVARVLEHADTHNLRMQHTIAVQSDLREQAQEEPKLLTMDGDIVGTPAYMSPEQASGQIDRMGPQSDVYSVGAMLYHLLAGRMPYVEPGEPIQGYAIWNRLREEAPTPLEEIVPDAPAELIAICEKAMTRDMAGRYRDMSDLAADLSAFIEHRVVRAYERGSVAELKKWIARNKALSAACAAVALALLAGLGTVGYVQAEGRKLAENEREVARVERDRVMRLAAFQDLEELRAEAGRLWPAGPELIAAYEAWIERAEGVIAGLDRAPDGQFIGHLALREEVRKRALPRTADEVEADRREHPRYAEWQALQAHVDSLRSAGEARAAARNGEGREARAIAAGFPLDPSLRFRSADELRRTARDLVHPDRTERGRETEGLALALLAEERGEERDPDLRETLAWACLANGLDGPALEAMERAVALSANDRRPRFEDAAHRLRDEITRAGGPEAAEELERLEAELAPLTKEVSARRRWTFADEEDRWWHNQLTKLIAEIHAFADRETGLVHGISDAGWGVARRLAHAREIEALTLTGVEAERRWKSAIESIADAEESPAYRGLRIAPQLGLLPIGRDPESGLWEFAHVQSGRIPERDGDGMLVVDGESCVVLVLLPGGSFLMGAQRRDRSAPRFDPEASKAEGPVHEIELAPFFLSKYELTQGQWQRFCGSNPASYGPRLRIRMEPRGFSLAHPVEMVSWNEAADMLARYDLALCTEAQWEYGALAGKDSIWSSCEDRSELAWSSNLADRHMLQNGGPRGWDYEEWNDGYYFHAPVGSFVPNAFGLHDVHGNVWELCRDHWGAYSAPTRGGEQERISKSKEGVARGGSYEDAATSARTASRSLFQHDERTATVGFRPSRMLREGASR